MTTHQLSGEYHMFGFSLKNTQLSLWQKFFPVFKQQNISITNPYDYYSVYFKNNQNVRFLFKDYVPTLDNEKSIVILVPFHQETAFKQDLHLITDMECEIIHFKKNHQLIYKNIYSFALDYYLKIYTVKNLIARMKGRLVSGLRSDKETISRDRYFLLRLMATEYVNQRPSRDSVGFTADEIIALLYGRLWYRHIRNEQFRRKINLLLGSLVITGDLREDGETYFIQGQAITTLVEYEKEERRFIQQNKMQKNLVRLMFIITVSTILIVLVLLAMAGIVDLHAIWQKILQIKPVRFILKII